MNNEIAWERAREKEMDNYFESFFEDDHFIFTCVYCGEKAPIKDMADVLDEKEDGICNECADVPHRAADWGLNE